MSVESSADERIDFAKRELRSAIVALGDVVVDGHDGYAPEYIEKLDRAFGLLLEARKLL